jgi:hypothetical protein
MTLAEARRILSSRGIVLRHQEGEFRVNYVRGREETAYYTNDLDDAVRTGLVMVHHGSHHHNPKWDVGERVKFRRDGTMVLPAHRHLNPKRLTRAKARLILHHGEVRGYPLTEPQRGFFGARASGYPRRNAMARGYGASALPAHYRRSRSRSRRLPPMAGHRIVRGGRHYVHNPGGTNWMPIVLIGAAAFFLLPRLTGAGGVGGLFGTSVLPAGYTYMGSGYYRGPDGQTYYRSPTTGQLAVASPAAATGAIAQNAGYGLINTTIGAVTGGLTSLIKGIFAPSSGGPVTTQAGVTDPSVVPGSLTWDPNVSAAEIPLDQPSLGGDTTVGLTPEPLPDFLGA